MAQITLPVSFPCGHTVSLMTGDRLPETCPACAIGIPEGRSRCEDYPCCGHTDGGGCIPRPEHTSAYWSRLYDEMGEEAYEAYCERMDMQEQGY